MLWRFDITPGKVSVDPLFGGSVLWNFLTRLNGTIVGFPMNLAILPPILSLGLIYLDLFTKNDAATKITDTKSTAQNWGSSTFVSGNPRNSSGRLSTPVSVTRVMVGAALDDVVDWAFDFIGHSAFQWPFWPHILHELFKIRSWRDFLDCCWWKEDFPLPPNFCPNPLPFPPPKGRDGKKPLFLNFSASLCRACWYAVSATARSESSWIKSMAAASKSAMRSASWSPSWIMLCRNSVSFLRHLSSMSAVRSVGGQAANTNSTFCWYTNLSPTAGSKPGTNEDNWLLTPLDPPPDSVVIVAPDAPCRAPLPVWLAAHSESVSLM